MEAMIRSDFFAPGTKLLPVINVHILHLIRTNVIGQEEKNTFAFQMNKMFPTQKVKRKQKKASEFATRRRKPEI